MATTVDISGHRFTRRSPLGAWGLLFLTLGVYGFVWYYKINDEARRYLGDDTIKPGVAVLAVTLGVFLLLIPVFISYYRTGERIQRMQQAATVQDPISPALGLVAAFVMSFHVVYMQEHLNRIWDRYAPAAPAGTPLAPPPAAQS